LFQSWWSIEIYGLLTIEHQPIGLFVVNDSVAVNIYNPQMMRCFVCHPTQLELLDAQRKHKGLVSYNKNHDTSALKKHVCHEHNFRFV
jgi:hypothetical protein